VWSLCQLPWDAIKSEVIRKSAIIFHCNSHIWLVDQDSLYAENGQVYTKHQLIYMDLKWSETSLGTVRRKFPRVRVPNANAIHNFVNKIRTNDVLTNWKAKCQHETLTEENLDELRDQTPCTRNQGIKRDHTNHYKITGTDEHTMQLCDSVSRFYFCNWYLQTAEIFKTKTYSTNPHTHRTTQRNSLH
jgi:hypothetical protein